MGREHRRLHLGPRLLVPVLDLRPLCVMCTPTRILTSDWGVTRCCHPQAFLVWALQDFLATSCQENLPALLCLEHCQASHLPNNAAGPWSSICTADLLLDTYTTSASGSTQP